MQQKEEKAEDVLASCGCCTELLLTQEGEIRLQFQVSPRCKVRRGQGWFRWGLGLRAALARSCGPTSVCKACCSCLRFCHHTAPRPASLPLRARNRCSTHSRSIPVAGTWRGTDRPK